MNYDDTSAAIAAPQAHRRKAFERFQARSLPATEGDAVGADRHHVDELAVVAPRGHGPSPYDPLPGEHPASAAHATAAEAA
jgi:hypothetical protein